MVFASGFSWIHLLPGVGDDTLLSFLGVHEGTQLVLHAWLATGILIVFGLFVRRGVKRAMARTGVERFYADDKLTARTAAELYVDAIRGMIESVLSPADTRVFFGLIGGLFAYIFTCNILGIFPGFLPPTDNVNTNVGMAVVVFLVFNYVGFRRDAKGYVKHMMGPIIWIAPLLLVVETISLFIRPVSLSIRLTGNMFGDHTVFTIMSDLVPLVVPSAFLGLAVFVSIVQAFVFSLLSTIYLGLSVPRHDHD